MNIIQVRLVLELSSWNGDVRPVMKGPAAYVSLLRSATLGCDRVQWEKANIAHGRRAGRCDGKASFFSTAKYMFNVKNKLT